MGWSDANVLHSQYWRRIAATNFKHIYLYAGVYFLTLWQKPVVTILSHNNNTV